MSDQPVATATQPKKGRGLLISGIVLLVVGVLGGIVAAVLLFGATDGFATLLTASPKTTPVATSQQFSRGIYFVYQDLEDPQQISTSDVAVTDSQGVMVNVYEPAANETLTLGSRQYADVAGFKITSPGEYRVNVATTGDRIIIGPSLGHAFSASLSALVVGTIASLCFVIGLVLLIIGIVSANSRRRKAVSPTLTMPANYGDWPLGPGYSQVDVNQHFPMQPGQQANPYAQPVQPVQPAPPVNPYAQPGQPGQPVPPAAPTQWTPQPAQPVVPPVQPVAQPQPQPQPQPEPQHAYESGPAAGWYPDPDPANPGGRRYWDGSAWTHYTA